MQHSDCCYHCTVLQRMYLIVIVGEATTHCSRLSWLVLVCSVQCVVNYLQHTISFNHFWKMKRDQQISEFTSQPIIQQDLKRCRLRSVPYCTSVMFFLLSVIYAFFFCFFGLDPLTAEVIEMRYDDVCGHSRTCLVSFEVKNTIPHPVGMYYKLTGFTQMRREIASSYSSKMLRGEEVSTSELKDCQPEIYYDDIPEIETLCIPCGLLPRNVFTDGFTLIADSGQDMPDWDEENIVLDVDKTMYSEPSSAYQNSSHWLKDSGLFTEEQTDPHFIVWMRQSPFTPFRKLYKVLSGKQGLPAGRYTMSIRNMYNATKFNGRKYFIIAHIGRFGTLKWGPAVVFGIMSLFFMVAAGTLGILGWRRSQPTSIYHPNNLKNIFVKS